jgi:hypothetical protein
MHQEESFKAHRKPLASEITDGVNWTGRIGRSTLLRESENEKSLNGGTPHGSISWPFAIPIVSLSVSARVRHGVRSVHF